MKSYLIVFTALTVLVVTLTLPEVLLAQETNPTAVVKTLEAATNAKDIEAAVALFADDATITLVPPPPDSAGPIAGKEAIRAWFEELATMNFTLEVEILKVEGDTVTTQTKTYSDFSRGLGIAPLEGTEVYIVQDGKLKSFTFTFTDESLAKLQAATAPTSLPQAGGAPAIPTRYLWSHSGGGLTELTAVRVVLPAALPTELPTSGGGNHLLAMGVVLFIGAGLIGVGWWLRCKFTL